MSPIRCSDYAVNYHKYDISFLRFREVFCLTICRRMACPSPACVLTNKPHSSEKPDCLLRPSETRTVIVILKLVNRHRMRCLPNISKDFACVITDGALFEQICQQHSFRNIRVNFFQTFQNRLNIFQRRCMQILSLLGCMLVSGTPKNS